MQQISIYPRVTVEDEVRLAKQIHGRNAAKKRLATETLIHANLRLVVKIAHDFKGMGLSMADLIEEGNIGLMRSVEKFDPTKGAKFSSYAAWWIKQSMHRALWNQIGTIRVPVQTGAKLRKVRLKREVLRLELGREPEISELAAALDFSERTVTMLLNSENSVFSLQDPIKSGENDTYEEMIPDTNAKSPETLCSNADSLQLLRESFTKLDPREQQVLIMRFYQGLTLEQASAKINRTRERVRQIQSQALRKLRAMMTEESEVVNS
ncbi:MAG: sigma-70 family RNA polymerase sigma factor [Lentisphaeria bacterium]|nr:sigma-70 family RNA polymerase sigma factor [Lentisphaeria bacterium]